jgi:predicted outer membrane protein
MSVIKYTMFMLALMCCNLAFAQQQTDQSRRAEGAQGGRELTLGSSANQGNTLDQFVATCLLIGNQEEVSLAQEAVSRAQNESVKQFAQMLIDDHQKAIQKLQQHAKPGISLGGAATVTASGQSQTNQSAANPSPTAQQYTANRADLDQNSASAGVLDHVLKMQQQAAQECLSMTKSILAEKQGAEFDKAFAGSQIGAHIGMLAKLKASQQHVSSDLASIIQESEQTVQSHLEQAKQLCKELESMQASNR